MSPVPVCNYMLVFKCNYFAKYMQIEAAVGQLTALSTKWQCRFPALTEQDS